MTVPGRTRLLLIEGPAALGVQAMQAIDEGTAARTLRDGLRQMMGKPRGVSLERLASLLSAAFDRAALDVECGADLHEVSAAVRHLLLKLVRAS